MRLGALTNRVVGTAVLISEISTLVQAGPVMPEIR